MSSTSIPISADRFAEAIKELPLGNLYSKGAEIRNSLAHLKSSNRELQSFAADGDSDCKDAIEENAVVIQSMERRLQLLKREVEHRGFKWGEDEGGTTSPELNGNGVGRNGSEMESSPPPNTERATTSVDGHSGGDERTRRVRERIEEQGVEDENGIHL